MQGPGWLITFSDDQLVLGAGGVGEGVVGLDKLARLRARVASDRIAWRRREDAVHTSVARPMGVEHDRAAIGGRLAVSQR